MKTILAIIAAVPATIGVQILKYFYQDWEFAKWICVAVLVDTLVSMVKHWIHSDFNSEDFWKGFAKKIFVYMMLMIASNILVNMTVNGHTMGTTAWIGEYLCVAMLIREVISIVENGNAIVSVCPIWLLKHLKDYNEKGEYINRKEREEQHDPEQNMED